MSERRKIRPFERAPSILHEGLRSAGENADDVRAAAKKLGLGFMEVVAIAIAAEMVSEFDFGRST